MVRFALHFTDYIIILLAGFVKAKVLTDRDQRRSSRYLRRRVACGTIPVAARKGENRPREGAMPGYSIFISYAHEDEPFKNALTRQLKGLQRRGVIDPWVDRCIDGGDEWRAQIRAALDGCHLALLLVSPAFIASDFIYTEELSRLLERRERDGIRVVPVILRLAEDGREDAEADGPRLLRGGSWLLNRLDCRCASRDPYHPGDRFDDYGFRLCCAPPIR
jgi:hypothetical protein